MSATVLFILAACQGGSDTASKDSAAAAAAPPAPIATATSIGATEGMKTPESVRYDAELDAFFVSNINGNPSVKDNNGLIMKIDAANTATASVFIEGGKNGVTLNAPKGLAIVGDTLWVADLDAVRAFNKKTGALIASIDLKGQQAHFLNDLVAGPDGSIYITDTGIKFDSAGTMSHIGPDQLFHIVGRKATVVMKGDALLRPNGIAWDATRNRFLLAPFGGPIISSWAPGDTATTEIIAGPGGYDGIEALADGRVLITSWTDSSVHVLNNGKLDKIITGVDAPADLGVDTKRNVVALPRFNAGKVEYWKLP